MRLDLSDEQPQLAAGCRLSRERHLFCWHPRERQLPLPWHVATPRECLPDRATELGEAGVGRGELKTRRAHRVSNVVDDWNTSGSHRALKKSITLYNLRSLRRPQVFYIALDYFIKLFCTPCFSPVAQLCASGPFTARGDTDGARRASTTSSSDDAAHPRPGDCRAIVRPPLRLTAPACQLCARAAARRPAHRRPRPLAGEMAECSSRPTGIARPVDGAPRRDDADDGVLHPARSILGANG